MFRTTTALLLLLLAGSLSAQQSPNMAPPGLLHLKLQGEPGSTVSFLNAPGNFVTLPTPVIVGLRPGMRYIFKVEGLQGAKGQTLYPTIEVTDVLYLPEKLKASDHPAPVTFSKTDIGLTELGSMITKYVVLEDTEGPNVGMGGVNGAEVVPVNCHDTKCFIKELGRLVAIVRMGSRQPTQEELNATPPQPQQMQRQPAPCGPDGCQYPMGMVPLKPFQKGLECIRDGGDLNGPTYRDSTGKLKGLDASDTVAEFTDSSGSKRILPTNIVCLCVPKFVTVREVTGLARVDMNNIAIASNGTQEGILMKQKEGARPAKGVMDPTLLRVRNNVAIDTGVDKLGRITDLSALCGVDMNLGPFTNIGTDQMRLVDLQTKSRMKKQIDLGILLSTQSKTSSATGKEGLWIIGMCENLGQVTGSLETRTHVYFCEDATPLTEGPLQLLKWCNTEKAQIGDTVTFTIKYTNSGSKPIREIAVTDSLSNRLEYIPGTARSSREAIFITEPNEVESTILRWEIKQPLPGNQTGTVSFQAKVR